MAKQASIFRRARRDGTALYPQATPEYIKNRNIEYVAAAKARGELFTREQVEKMLTDSANIHSSQMIHVVYTAIMESHVAGWTRLHRDIDPIVVEILKGVDRITETDGGYVADAKLIERYNMARKRTERRKRGGADDV